MCLTETGARVPDDKGQRILTMVGEGFSHKFHQV